MGRVSAATYLIDPLLVDRQAHRRDEVDLQMADAVVASRGAVLARDGRLVAVPGGAVEQPALRAFLGHHGGRDVGLAVPADVEDARAALASLEDGAEWVPLRAFIAQVGPDPVGQAHRELATTAVALAAWHDSHGCCARCGAPTVAAQGGWVRHCEVDGRDHYPRTDPAIIVAVTDAEDRLLLGHAAHWSDGRYSHLAGYVEPGESFEQAVHREVAEEVGVDVSDITYVASQPWPFPASVMVGFRARATTTELSPDGVEITDARWVSRAEFDEEVRAQRIVPPPVGSIARSLLEDWLGGAADSAAADDVTDT